MKAIFFLLLFLGVFLWRETGMAQERIPLPEPERRGAMSVEETISRRRSVRSFEDRALTLRDLSQLLFAIQGMTDHGYGLRTVPSAGALYPLEVYAVVGKVEGVAEGVYRYHPEGHELERTAMGDKRIALYKSALYQESIREAPLLLVLSAFYERTTRKYGERGIRYVHMEAGHAAQNVYLQAEALGLGTVVIGAFRDTEVARVLGLPENEVPLYLMPVGKPRR
ncbi:MAG: SagB/ThcOx family dehydrogenase [Candidatus Caldatribacteriaceae bacterium]